MGFDDFVKLMDKLFNDVRVKDILKVPVKWDKDSADNAFKRLVMKEVNIFERHGAKKDKVKTYVDLCWSDSAHGVNTPKYHKVYDTVLGNMNKLNTERNKAKMKSAYP